MSKAGITSNRGDGYQTLVAFHWALIVLSDPSHEWLEIDSVTWAVDDVVIGRSDGSKICCQCKKNQTEYKAWSISDLKDELYKAIDLLNGNGETTVRFYSRSNFGDIAALREFSINYTEESMCRTNMGQAHQKTDRELTNLLSEKKSRISTYQFLQRVKFEVSPELDTMENLLYERLRQLVSNHSVAFDVMWTSLDRLGMRFDVQSDSVSSQQHRLTKNDLLILINKAGSILASPAESGDIRSAFHGISAIGRSWRRDIGSELIATSEAKAILEAIEQKACSILLTGIPGSGKTCVMMAVQDELERIAKTRSDLQPLFIQSREFSDMATTQDRQSQGLPEHWVERAARLAESTHVVVVIDSLDVLSIAREHSVLQYFLAQIDRLLLIDNVTIVASCREFDSHYDKRLAHRIWEKRITCSPLSWSENVIPLLNKLGIDSSSIDATTKELICNPRELALFVDLAQKTGSFNVVTSNALAQRYLADIVQTDSMQGDQAMRAIEDMATEMLQRRSLSVPHQRFSATQEIKRVLLSNKVLHETQDGQLTFGHQTLLDVLVISGAIRQAVTLNEFIDRLPPVPFVRPSIRSFVMHLISGDRRELRKQLRTVLTSHHAFHIRRLVAETLAEHIPHEDDWLLMRDLRNQHRDIFQVIYAHATKLEWHYFWMKNLVPMLRDTQDFEALAAHAHRISRWKNDDPIGAISLWTEILQLDCLEKTNLVNSIARYIEEIDVENLDSCSSLIASLLNFPRDQHSFLGHAIARAVKFGNLDDSVLWDYIVGDINNNDVMTYHLNNKLHCDPYEFGSKNEGFLADRMKNSTALLNLAVGSVEQWCLIKSSHYGSGPKSYLGGFLNETSYCDAHTKHDIRHVSAERILFDAIEIAILHHANENSNWWVNNRERLCFNAEGAFCYFAILACTSVPIANLELIGRILCDKTLLESTLSYELGALIEVAFIHLDTAVQDAIVSAILSVRNEYATDPAHIMWAMQAQAELILAIPCHLRSSAALSVLNECEKSKWPLVRHPEIHSRGGTVSAPFSFEIFLDASDAGILRLLDHYNGYLRGSFSDFLVGGEREVGWQLREAASRAPARFIEFLRLYWEEIPDSFRDEIMDGIAAYLAYSYGNLQSNNSWASKESPDAIMLTQRIFDELERHHNHWHHNRAASKAIEGCADVITQPNETLRLVSLAMDFSTLDEDSPISGDSVDLLTSGINMAKGNISEALMVLACHLDKKEIQWPESLSNALRIFAKDKHPAIRALILRRLPYLQSHHPEFGWELFDLVMKESTARLWSMAEPCLYYAYHHKFDIVAPWLERILNDGPGQNLEVWARISALAALSNRIEFSLFLEKLQYIESIDAWEGAFSVWTHVNNIQTHREQCLSGLESGLSLENTLAIAVARKFSDLFRNTTPLIFVPSTLIQRCLNLLSAEAEPRKNDIYGFDEWLNAISLIDPLLALETTEYYLDYVRNTNIYLYNHDNNLTQLITKLFEQAEEQEESDNGAMLQRVIVVQDIFLTLGVNGMDEWLKAAER